MRPFRYALAAAACLVAGLACSLPRLVPSPAPSAAAPVTGGATDLARQLEAGWVAAPDIHATGGDIQGPVMVARIVNLRDEEVTVTLPCGLLFEPQDEGEQRMMVIQEASATLGAGEEAELTPYVICIDSERAAPGENSAYVVGSMAMGDVLTLAQCLCQQDLEGMLDPTAPLAIQFAVWMASEGKTYSDMLEEEGGEGALGDLLGGEAGQLVQGLLAAVEGPAMTWLERCGVTLGD